MFINIKAPDGGARSFKDMARDYVLIVLSIVTALGLEQAITAHRHARLVSDTVTQIEEELRANLIELEDSLTQNRARQAALVEASTLLRESIQGRKPKLELVTVFPKEFGVTYPSLRRDAWEAAIANQALSLLGANAVRRYSSVYSAQRDAAAFGQLLLTGGNLFSRGTDVAVDVRLGRADPTETLKFMVQYQAVLGSTINNLESMGDELRKALGMPAVLRPGKTEAPDKPAEPEQPTK